MKYHVVTFGCRVNQADSLAIEDVLRLRGGVAVDAAEAELVVVNSCSVTSGADQGTRQVVRRIARNNPDVRVVVTGCYATRRPDEVAALPQVCAVVDNDQKDAFGPVLDLLSFDVPLRFVDGEGPCGSTLAPGVAGRTALTLRVQTGCDESCSYCIIPRTRGRGRSRALADVLGDVERAVTAGYREVVITGVHIGSYGRDLSPSTSLVDLLHALATRTDDVLFRISSLEPMDCTEDIVDLVAASPRLAPHFHLPLQHGSDRILRTMRRPYSAAAYEALVERIHDVMPWAAIGTDLIVGFPGETEDDVERTERLIRRLPLSYLHVFPYSDRPDTEATAMLHKVPGERIRERGRRLRHAGEDLGRRFRASQAGCSRRALTVDDGEWAVTDNYIKVPLPDPQPRNQWVDVVIPPA
jgi:threonylcarbamoyladenosine tRNA methylthiotransferase MtaB